MNTNNHVAVEGDHRHNSVVENPRTIRVGIDKIPLYYFVFKKCSVKEHFGRISRKHINVTLERTIKKVVKPIVNNFYLLRIWNYRKYFNIAGNRVTLNDPLSEVWIQEKVSIRIIKTTYIHLNLVGENRIHKIYLFYSSCVL